MSDRRSFLGSLAALFAGGGVTRPDRFASLAMTGASLAMTSAAPPATSAPSAPSASAPPRMPSDLRGLPDDRFWSELRREFTIPTDEAFFNTGTLGSSPRAVQEAVIAHMRHVDRDIAHWDYLPDHEQYFTGYFAERALRDKLGSLINASGADVALTQNATFGMNFVANGLDLKPGDEVVATDQAHPGGWKGYELRAERAGIVVRQVKVPEPANDPDQLVRLYLDATGPRTRVWAIPHISSSRAIRYPVDRLCRLARERGIWSVVDGAQSLGHVVVDVKKMDCDVFFGSPHKWLLAPKGTGLLYVRPERQRELWPTLASSAWNDEKDPMLRLMQYGTGNLSLLVGLDKACDFHAQIGSEKVERRIVGLADRLRRGLAEIPGIRFASPTHPELRCATTVFGLEGVEGQALQDWLWERGRVRVRAVGPDHVRHCCHIYNNEGEVDRTVKLVRERAAGGPRRSG